MSGGGPTGLKSGMTGAYGAGATLASVGAHEGLRRVFPGVVQAASEAGSPRVRSAETLGDNLGRQSRCWYFRRRGVRCAKKGGSTCFARIGECSIPSSPDAFA